jgi:hypothetical protein
MAYNQSSLKNIGDIKDNITKRKLNKKFGSEVGAEKFKQIEDFRSRQKERSKPKVRTMETSFKTSIKPFEKETIKFDIPENGKTKKPAGKVKMPKSKVKTRGGSGGVIREKSGGVKRALIGLGTMGAITLGATGLFGTHRSYGSENTKNLGGN